MPLQFKGNLALMLVMNPLFCAIKLVFVEYPSKWVHQYGQYLIDFSLYMVRSVGFVEHSLFRAALVVRVLH